MALLFTTTDSFCFSVAQTSALGNAGNKCWIHASSFFRLNRKKTIFSILLISVLHCTCKRQQNQQNILDPHSPEVVEAKPYIVPKDSMATPKFIPAGKPKVVRAGKPTVVHVKNNSYPVGIPKTVIAGIPKICGPGKDSFLLPKVAPAISRPFVAGIPEIVIAKDAVCKDQNPQNFSSFGKLEGLRSGAVTCLEQDKKGNIWIGTWGGGVSKYDGKNFTHLTEKEGLSSNNVWQILEDSSGNLWFGGDKGVSKYDGKYFTNYAEKEGLFGHGISSIFEEKTGILWFGTYGGVSKYDGNYFTHFSKGQGLANNVVTSIFEDRSGNLWFGGDRGVSKYYDNAFTNYTEKEGLSNNAVLSIQEDSSGNLWFGGDKGVSKYDGKYFTNYAEKEGLNINTLRIDRSGNLWFGTLTSGVWKYDGNYFTHFTVEDGLANNLVHCIFEDRSGDIWLGTEGGVSKHNGKTFTQFTREDGLINDEVNGMTEDNLGNLWMGTNRGVSKYDGNSFTNFTEEQGLGKAGVHCSLVDRSGNLWFGTHKKGVSRFDGIKFTRFTEKEGLIGNEVNCLLQDRSGNIWMGTWAGVSKYDGKSFWNYTEKQGLSNNIIWNILEDEVGNFWFGTWGGGVTEFDGKTFRHFTVKEGLSGNKVLGIIEDKAGNIWIGTDGGVSKYDGNTFTHFTEKEGLSSDEVYGAIKDKSGNLWFGTNFGLNKLAGGSLLKLSASVLATTEGRPDKGGLSDNPDNVGGARNVLFKSYSYEDGFLAIGCKENAIYQDRNGTIWIGAKDRLTAYHPEGDKRDTIAPNVQLTGVALFNENIPWASLEQKEDTNIVLGNGVSFSNFNFEGISNWYYIPEHLCLPYNNNYLTFSYIGIETNSPKKVKYQYKLDGLEKNWSGLTTRTEAPYGNLPPGNYSFKVKAMNSEGYWSKEFIYSFTIRPPWWQTWWAYLIYALLMAVGIWAIVHNRSRSLRRELQHRKKEQQLAELQQQKTELEMQALRAQMNPHFIFNSLNSINRFILQNNRTQASEYLTKFSRLVRLILQNSQVAFISLENELESLSLYLDLESLRFDYRFGYKISVPEDLDVEMLKVPPLIIQPYTENAIWHGLMHKEEKGQLDIEISEEDSFLYIRIADNGIGRKKAAELASKSATKHKSMGLRITEHRISVMNQSNGQESPVKINDLVNPDSTAAGTEVIIKIPAIYD